MDPSALIDRYCKVWSEPDAGDRAELLASVWVSHATYTNPSVHAANAHELLNHIAKVQARRPGATVVRTSKVDIHNSLARFTWHVVQADGIALLEGLDVAFIAPASAKIERVIGFFGPLAKGSE